MTSRIGRVERVTKESKVLVEIDLHGSGTTEVSSAAFRSVDGRPAGW